MLRSDSSELHGISSPVKDWELSLRGEGSEQASPADVHYPRRHYPRRREEKEGIGSGAMLYSWGVAQTRLRKYLLPEQV